MLQGNALIQQHEPIRATGGVTCKRFWREAAQSLPVSGHAFARDIGKRVIGQACNSPWDILEPDMKTVMVGGAISQLFSCPCCTRA
eukprot:406019-Pelagomonas_calceolata.AAC.8